MTQSSSPAPVQLAAYGAYVVVAALVAAFAGFVRLTWPASTGGMNWDLAWVTWISCVVPVIALIAAHVVLAGQLLEEHRRPRA